MFVALIVATCMYAYDFTFKSGDYLYGATSDTTVEVAQDASYSSLTAIDIPATVERNGKTYTVTSIAEDAFSYCYDVASIVIPNTLSVIGYNAFNGTAWYNSQSDGLVYIDQVLYKYKGTMPNGMAVAIKKGTTSISPYAFYGCEGLAGIIFPSTLTYIGYAAFANCSSLSEITFPASLKEIDSRAFIGCTALASITLPESITNVGNGAFNGCTGLTEVITSAKQFGSEVFDGCTKLTSVTWNASQYAPYYRWGNDRFPFYNVRTQITSFTFGTSVDSIPEGICYDMGELTSVTIPDNVVYIKSEAFQSCSSLKSVTFSKNITGIGYSAFQNCVSLADVVLPTSLTTIRENAFRGCSEIKSITIPQNVNDMEYYCFAETGISSVVWNVKSILNVNRPFGEDVTAITSFVLGEEVEKIPSYLCYYTPNITSIVIPAGVKTIETNAFAYCTDVEFKSVTPPSIAWECFAYKATLKVPCGSLQTYMESGNYSQYILSDLEYLADITTNSDQGWVYKTTDCEQGILIATAYPNDTSKFVQWNDGNTDNPRTMVLTRDTTLTAEFATLPAYTVTLKGRYLSGDVYNSKGHFVGSLSNMLQNNTLTCREGWYFWVEENGDCGTWLGWSDGVQDRNRTITITNDTTIISSFDAREYAISITAGEHGRLLIDENTYGSVVGRILECDAYSVNVCAIPDDGYYFAQWSDGNTTDICRDIYLSEDITLIAQFAQKKQVSVKAEVASGCANMGIVALSEAGVLYTGDNASITAIPNEGYHFVEWEDGSVDNPRTVYLTSDTTLVATFAKGNIGGKCGEKLYWVLDTMTICEETGRCYYSNTLTITGEGAMNVNSYSNWKAYGNYNIRKIYLPEGMTSISSEAFRESRVDSIVIPSTVTRIGSAALAYCYNLVRFEFEPKDSENTSYSSNLLYNTPFLKYFKGPGEVIAAMYPYGSMLDTVIATGGELYEYIPYNARYVDLSRLDNVWLGTYYTVSTPKIRTLLLPKKLQRIASHQFWNYSYLQSIVIPEGVTFIGDKAFEDCRSLKSVTFEGKSVETIGDWAFYNCHELNSITIPEGVKSIGLSAFYGCTYLKDLKLPSTVESIADNGFAQCSKLQQISVSAMVPPVIDAKTFEGVDKTIPLLVPVGMRQAYADAPYWQEFINIREELPSDVSNAVAEDGGATVRKVLRDGQVLIIRNGKTYTITGEAVK